MKSQSSSSPVSPALSASPSAAYSRTRDEAEAEDTLERFKTTKRDVCLLKKTVSNYSIFPSNYSIFPPVSSLVFPLISCLVYPTVAQTGSNNGSISNSAYPVFNVFSVEGPTLILQLKVWMMNMN